MLRRSSRVLLTATATFSLFATPALAAPGDWQPTSPPATATWVVLESTPGDYVGQGADHTYTPAEAVIEVGLLPGGDTGFAIAVDGDESWSGRFEVPAGEPLDEKLYDGATRHPFNGEGAGLSWTGEGRGCNQATGWFQVDGFNLDPTGTAVEFLLLRFEQWCDSSNAPLNGAIRFDAHAPDPGPANPREVPPGLWTPPAGALPADAAPVVYLDSVAGDWVGQGQTWLHTGDEVEVGLATNHRGLHVDVTPVGDGWWDGDFAPPDDAAALEVGWYGDLQRYPFHNPVYGGLSWSGFGRGCNTLDGWFAVDQLEVATDGTVEVLSLRFQQHCEGLSEPPLRGIVQVGIDRTPPDTTAPTVTISAGPADRTKARDATFAFSADEPATFSCALDDLPAETCTSPWTITDVGSGAHTMTIVATDTAGNASEPAVWSWSVRGKGGGGDDGGGKGNGNGPKR